MTCVPPRSRVVAAIGDIHLDSSPNGRLAEAERVCIDAINDAAERSAAALVIAGDLFQHTRSNAIERNTAVRIVRHAGDRMPVLILRGNHDGLGELDFLRHLSTQHPVIVEDGYGVHVIAGVAIACAAWPCKASLLARADATSVKAADKALLAAFRGQMERLGAELARHTGPKMLVAHAAVRGATTSVGQPLVGCDLEVSLEDLALAGARLTVLGHIHKAQAWRRSGQAANDWKLHDFECEGLEGAVLYAGSPRPTDFGDLDDKSYLLVHFDDTDDGEIRPVGWERISTTATPLHVAQATWTGERLDFDESLADHAGAEVQLRYTFPAKDTPRVAPQAAALRADLLAAGAAKVHLAPKKIAATEARAPQVSEARTVSDKIRAYWDLHGAPPAASRILGRLDDLSLAAAVPAPRPGWMRYRRLRARGLRPFTEEIDLNLDELQGPLIAVTGEPGAGKSTFVEAFAAHFPGRELRTHGKVKDVVVGTDAFLEVTFDCAAGDGLSVRQTFGKRTNNVEVLTASGEVLKDADGREVLPKCGAAEYDTWAKANLPHTDSYFASTFLAQDRRDFLYLDSSPRKGVLLRVAGVEYLEGLAEAARKKESAARKVLATLQGKSDELRRALGLPELYGDPKKPSGATVLCQTTEERRMLAQKAVAAAEVDVRLAEEVLTDAQKLAAFERERALLREKLDELTKQAGALNVRAKEHRTVLAERKAIERAEQDIAELTMKIDAADREVDHLVAEAATLDVRLAEAVADVQALAKDRHAMNERRAEDRQRVAKRLADVTPRIERYRAMLATIDADLADPEMAARVRAAAAEVERLTGEHAEAKAAVAAAQAIQRDAIGDLAGCRDRAAETAAHAAHRRSVAEMESQRPALICLARALRHERAHAAAQLDECLRVHEIRATHLRAYVEQVADGDIVDGAQDEAQKARAADDERLARANHDAIARLRARIAEIDAEMLQQERAHPAWPPSDDTSPSDAERCAHDAVEAAIDAEHNASIALLAHVFAGIGLAVATGVLDAAERETLRVADELDKARALAARLPALERREHTHDLLVMDVAEEAALLREQANIPPDVDRSLEELEAAGKKGLLITEVDDARTKLAVACAARASLMEARAAHEKTAAGRARLVAAEATLAEIDRQLQPIEADGVATRTALLMLEERDVVLSFEGQRRRTTTGLSLAQADSDLDTARGDLATARERASVVEQNLATLVAREAERAAALADAEDWEDLAYTLGRNGIQADEVDAIGPRVASLATMLLHECFSTNWTITEIDTVGTCDVMVAVAEEKGDPRSDRTFSPGQRAILAGVMAMAISTIEAQNAGTVGTTLFFDEAGAPLSPALHGAWVRMIRKAVEIVGADKAIFISQDPGATAQADTRIVVADGRVRVE